MNRELVYMVEKQVDGKIFWWTGNTPSFDEPKLWTTEPTEGIKFKTRIEAHSRAELAGIQYNMDCSVTEHEFINTTNEDVK